MNFGVSPAWFLSLYGESFTLRQAGESLRKLKKMGFSSWQPEIFHEDALEEWNTDESGELRTIGIDLGLEAGTFVAHFLGSAFADDTALTGRRDLDLLERLLDALKDWDETSVISLPLPPFFRDAQSGSDRPGRGMESLEDKLRAYASRIESSGRILALEAMPGNLTGGSAGLADLVGHDGLEKVGVNYDSGHFHAAGESQDLVLSRLGSRIACTHLCDNDGINNQSLAPGDGTIPWNCVMAGLKTASYSGNLDLEIRCSADTVETAYKRGREHLERQWLKESA